MVKTNGIRCFLVIIFILSVFFAVPSAAFSLPENETEKCFRTSYCDVYYDDESTLGSFFWRISGKRFDFTSDTSLARSRLDRLIDRVQDILDMYPVRFHVRINLFPQYENGLVALYSRDTNSLTIYADKVTDGILAHEVAHAVINDYFSSPLPAKMQEILTQYVDKHLWDDY